MGRRGIRLCRSDGCLTQAARGKRYCPECVERLSVNASRDAKQARARLKSPEMRAVVNGIREQVRRMAERDPFYSGGPA